ncbi:MAG: hypothetical protein ABR589_08650 [Chthoniobacterales bacterium]
MAKRFMCLLITVSAVGAVTLFAQEGTTKPAEGTLILEKKTYPLKHALAYETTIDNEDAITLVLSGQAVASEKLKEARDAEKEGADPDFNRPFLRLIFKKTGELKYWSAAAGGTSLGRRSGTATGELKLEDGRVSGKASQPMETEGMFPSGFDARFDVALLKAGESLPASSARKGGPAADVKPTVTGIFKGNGKEAKLAYVSARWGEPFSGKPGIVLVFTEKDHSKEKKPDLAAAFGRFGSALIISLHEDGGIYGCQVVHSAHQKQGFSSIGSIEATEFAYADGKVEGELTTHGEKDTFGEKWDVNIKFVAPLGEIPKELQPAESKKPEKEEKRAASKADENEDDEEPATKSTGAEAEARDLALTKDASDVEYKALVEQIVFKSKSDVKSVCAELAANLKGQGWTNDGKDMVQPHSSILKRKRGDATLTIFVKPADGGSEVKMMTEGLSWEEQ